MSVLTSRRRIDPAALGVQGRRLLARRAFPRALLSWALIIGALFAFEIFNYSTTEFALNDALGDLSFASLRWATILALAFCGMDFAGIARLFSPREGQEQTPELWYLLGAWLLAATMNAVLTWWAVSLALLSHAGLGNEILGRDTLLSTVPIFVAILVWLIRVLLIGTFSMSLGSPQRAQDMEKATMPTPTPSSRSAVRANSKPDRKSDGARPFTPAPKPTVKASREY